VRAKGISVFQWWGRCAGFFNQFVNPIGIKNAGWKYYISYCIFLAFEVVFVYFIFPETSGKSLEELAFCKFPHFQVLFCLPNFSHQPQCSKRRPKRSRGNASRRKSRKTQLQ
jgi:hypothetical protein